MTGRARAIAAAEAEFDSGRFRAALARLVAIPSESQEPGAAPHLRAYLEAAMIPALSALGCACRLHHGAGGGPPLLVASRIEDPARPTVLTYAHGDVTRGQAGGWREGTAPFALSERDGRLYGRGTTDNEGQHLVNLTALAAVLATRGALGFNLEVPVETGEEIGSPGLRAFCAAEADAPAADVLIASDGPRITPARPTNFLGSRGAITFDLVAAFRDGAHHSGNLGGLIADPALVLAHAIAAIADARGQIRVPGWRPGSTPTTPGCGSPPAPWRGRAAGRRTSCRTSRAPCPTTASRASSACRRSGSRSPMPAAPGTRRMSTCWCRSPARRSASWPASSGTSARRTGRPAADGRGTGRAGPAGLDSPHDRTRSHRRRRHGGVRGGLGGRLGRPARGPARDAARARHRGAPHRPARRARLLELVPLGRS
jgi:hypothetical protein